MRYRNFSELVTDMTGRPNTWTAITEWTPAGIQTTGYWSEDADYHGDGIVFHGGETRRETRLNIQRAILGALYGPYWNCPNCVRREWTVKVSRLRQIFQGRGQTEKPARHPFCGR